jgi:iron(III) transport system ATP-binding protein
MSLAALTVESISFTYPGESAPAVDQVSLSVAPGEHVALLGASGCGKTTLLRLIAGFERAQGGRLTIAGRIVSDATRHLPPEQRHVAMVFQDLALFPHLTLAGNVAFGLVTLRPAERARRIAEMMALCSLGGLERRFPHEVSGGQRQRAALARALAPGFPLLLLDEPLSSLDPTLRADLRSEVSRILKNAGVTTVVVTHDRDDAFAFADRVGVMRAGHLEQIGAPRELLDRPASRAVATALAEGWFLPASRANGGWMTEVGLIPAHTTAGDADHGEVLVRAHEVELRPDAGAGAVLTARVFRGHEDFGIVRLASGRELGTILPSESPLKTGDRVAVLLRPGRANVFPAPLSEPRPSG